MRQTLERRGARARAAGTRWSAGMVAAVALVLPATASAQTLTFRPVADTYTRSDVPTQNFGTASDIRADKSPITNAYLRFDVEGLQGPVTKATLVLRSTTSANVNGVDLRAVADNGWSETGLDFGNAPAIGGTIVSHVGAFSSGQSVSFDVTSLVKGDGPVSLALATTSTTSRGFKSREDATDPPQLVVDAVDAVAPGVGLDTPADGALAGTATPSFSGAAGTAQGDEDTVTVRVHAGTSTDGTPLETFSTSAVAGAWLATAPDPLPDGTYTVTAEQADAAGNLGVTSARTFTVAAGSPDADTTPPLVAVAQPADGSSTIDPTPRLGGAAGTASGDAGAVFVEIYSGSDASGRPVQRLATTQDSGSWSVDASAQLAEGTYTARAEEADAAGNLGESAPTTFHVVAPVVAAAGDIACDPANTKFNKGIGKSTGCRQKYTSDLLVGQGLTAVLPVGDEQYDCAGHSAFLQSYDPTWGRVKDITYPVLGNHEYQTAGGTDCDATGKAGGYFQYFGAVAGSPGSGYYSYDLGGWHIVALNTNDTCEVIKCSAGSAQEQWLKADLAAHPAQCTLAYWHAPRFRSGTLTPGSTYKALWTDLYAAHADLILNGHIHNYERFAPQDVSGAADPTNGIREFILGTGGASHASFNATIAPNSEVRDATAFGVLRLTLHSDSYDWQFVPEAGKTFTDSGSTRCH